jgi:PAS domain S-box-containing protein
MNQQEDDRIAEEIRSSISGPDPFAAAVRSTRMPMVIADARLPNVPIVFVNDAFLKLTGYERSEILGKNCRFLQGEGTNSHDVAKVRGAIAAATPIEIDLLNYKKDGTHFWNRCFIKPVFHEGELTYFFASQYDATMERERLVQLQRDRDELEAEVAKNSAALRASEERLRFALEAGRLGVWTIDLTTGELTASDICKSICGRAPTDSLTLEELRESIHPDDRLLQVEAIDEAIANRSLLDAEYRLTTPAGEERWVQIRGQANYDADGKPLTITGTTQDVTGRRVAQGHRALLAREMSHRVKNTLASLHSVVAQTLRRSSTIEEAGQTISARIYAMAAANDLLITENFGSAGMRDLILRTLAPFGVDDGQRFRLAGPDVRLPPQVVIAYALALHELATNASKYGALSNADGQVTMDWTVEEGNLLKLVWEESAGPEVVPPEKTSFGTQLIQRVLATELGGKATIDYRPGGVVFTAIAPLGDARTEVLT